MKDTPEATEARDAVLRRKVADDQEVLRDLSRRAKAAFYRMLLPDGRYEYVSSGCQALFGFSPQEFYDNPLLVERMIHPDSRPYFEQAWARLLAGDMPASYEYSIVDRAQRQRWLRQENVLVRDDNGRPVAIEGIVSEFTAHKKHAVALEHSLRRRTAELEAANVRLQAESTAHQSALAELRNATKQLRLLTDNLPAAISYVDAKERYRFVNRAYEEWFGHTQAQILGKSVAEVLGEAAYAVIEERVRTALSGHAVTFEGSIPYARGGTRYVRASYIPHWDEQHARVRGFFVLVSDISAAKEAEMSERRHLQELAHAARLASLGEMAAELSHELAQPLSAIRNYAYACRSLLAKGEAERASELLAKLGAQSELAGEIAGGYRRFVQKGSPEKQRVDLGELTRSALKLVLWETDARRIPVALEIPEAVPPIWADRTLIEQVILNLVRNAIEAMDNGAASDKSIRIVITAEGDAAQVSVHDHGVGLTPEAKQHLFEPFFTTKGDGVGIGLVVCRRIITSHGGTLWAEDNPDGGGAVFSFRLPQEKAA